MTNHYVETTAYLQVRRDEQRPWLGRGTVARVTTKRPDPPLPGVVVVKVILLIPRVAFEPLTPEAVIEVPLDLVQRPVEIEAVEP